MQAREWHFYPRLPEGKKIVLIWILLLLLGAFDIRLLLLSWLTSIVGVIGMIVWQKQRTSREFIRLGTMGFSFQIDPDPKTYHIPYAALLYCRLDYQHPDHGGRMINVKFLLEYRLPEDDPDSEPREQMVDLNRLQYSSRSVREYVTFSEHPYDQTVRAIYHAILAHCAQGQLATYSPKQAMRDKAWLEKEKQRTREWLDKWKNTY